MRNVCAAALIGAVILGPALADSTLVPGKPAGVKKAQAMDSPVLGIALVGAIGLAAGLVSADDGITPPPATSTTTT